MRENPGDEEFYKMKDTDKLWRVRGPIPIPIDDRFEFSLDKKTIYCLGDYYNLPPNARETLDKEDPVKVVERVIGWENASPELVATAQAQIDGWEDEYDESEDDDEYGVTE